MFIQTTYVNLSEGYIYGEEPWQKSCHESRKDLFLALRKELGKPSKMYIDTETGAKQVGWVFSKKEKYSDTGEPFSQEAWVTVSKSNPCKLVVESPWDKEKTN